MLGPVKRFSPVTPTAPNLLNSAHHGGPSPGFIYQLAADETGQQYNLNTRAPTLVLIQAVAWLAACGESKRSAVQDLASQENLSSFTLHSLAGTRDGDRLHVQAIFSDSSSILTVEMHFAIGSPTTLESGTWRWSRNGQLLSGTVAGRSVTFLGGQDGPPSIGGTFDLLGSDGAARYRVNIPVTQLKTKWKG